MRRRLQEQNEFDDMLREHFAAELDDQTGRAGRAFEAHLRRHARTYAPAPSQSRTRTWLIGAIGSAMAATLAAFWVVPRVWHRAPSVTAKNVAPINYMNGSGPSPAVAEITPQWEEVQNITSSGAQDKGVVVLDNQTPARIVRRVSMERTEWVDPKQGVRVEVVVPREKVMLIGMDTY